MSNYEVWIVKRLDAADDSRDFKLICLWNYLQEQAGVMELY